MITNIILWLMALLIGVIFGLFFNVGREFEARQSRPGLVTWLPALLAALTVLIAMMR